jgi:hypothetical protein
VIRTSIRDITNLSMNLFRRMSLNMNRLFERESILMLACVRRVVYELNCMVDNMLEILNDLPNNYITCDMDLK